MASKKKGVRIVVYGDYIEGRPIQRKYQMSRSIGVLGSRV